MSTFDEQKSKAMEDLKESIQTSVSASLENLVEAEKTKREAARAALKEEEDEGEEDEGKEEEDK